MSKTNNVNKEIQAGIALILQGITKVSIHDIDSVYVEWSESYEFEDNTTYTYDEFNKRCKIVLDEIIASGDDGCCKAGIKVNFTDGKSYSFRLDIAEDESNIAKAFDNRKEYYTSDRWSKHVQSERELAEYWKNFTYLY